MINTWLISGDIHGSLTRFTALKDYEPGTAAIIILGDVAFNYTANSQDNYLKNRANSYKNYIYCVRGNHEMRPEDVPTMEKFWDENVANMVYCEPEYPYIRYFIDGYCYDIGITFAFPVLNEEEVSDRSTWRSEKNFTPHLLCPMFVGYHRVLDE